jgi:hypothetical protein
MARPGGRQPLGWGASAALLIVVAACGSGTSASSPTATLAGAGATPQPTEPFTITEAELAPGRYLQAFPPRVSFTLGAGWHGYFDDAGGSYLGHADGIEMGINRPPKVVDPKTSQGVDAPADLASWLAKSPAFKGAKSSAAQVGGVPARLIDATATRELGLFFYTDGNFHTVSGARYHFYVVPLEGPDLVILFAGPAAQFDASLPRIKDIVGSVKLGQS